MICSNKLNTVIVNYFLWENKWFRFITYETQSFLNGPCAGLHLRYFMRHVAYSPNISESKNMSSKSPPKSKYWHRYPYFYGSRNATFSLFLGHEISPHIALEKWIIIAVHRTKWIIWLQNNCFVWIIWLQNNFIVASYNFRLELSYKLTKKTVIFRTIELFCIPWRKMEQC